MVTKKDLVDTAIRKALAGLKLYPKGSCPDDNIVAAYLEGGLSSPDRLHFEDHASTCVNCQELVALSTRLLDAENTQDSPAKTSPYRIQRFLFRFPLPALALLLVAVAIGIIFRDERQKQPEPESAPTLTASRNQAKNTEAPKLNQAPPPMAIGELEASAVRKTKERADKSGRRYAEEKPASSPPISETKSTVLMDSQEDFRTREKRNESAAAGLKKDENLSAPAARTRALGQTLPVAQAGGEISLRNAIAGLSQQRRLQEGDSSNKAAQSADRVAIVGGNLQRRIGKRVFHLASGYWIDSQCGEHPDSDIVEITAESPEYAEIRRESPEIEELRTSGVPILVHWKSKNYVIRQ